MSYSVGHRRISDPKLLWLCCRPAAAALIRPLAWELSYAASAALKRQKKKKKKKKKRNRPGYTQLHGCLPDILLSERSQTYNNKYYRLLFKGIVKRGKT